MIRRLLRRARRETHGANLVEFALISIPFLMITLGVIDFGRAIFAYSALAHGTREASRVAIVSGSTSNSPITQPQAEAIVRTRAVGLGGGSLTVSLTPLPDLKPGSRVRIESTYAFQPLTTFAIRTPITLRSRSEMTISR
jgi:Flp pilus assembly protein TadG